MRCKGPRPRYKLKKCESTTWELVWAHALTEEGDSINLWQCKQCKRVVMASQRWRDSDNWA